MKLQHGFTLLESIIALSIMSISITAFIKINHTLNQNTITTQKLITAHAAALGIAKIIAANQTTNFKTSIKLQPNTNNQQCLQQKCSILKLAQWSSHIFTANLNIKQATVCINKNPNLTTVTIAWPSSNKLQRHNLALSKCSNQQINNGVIVETNSINTTWIFFNRNTNSIHNYQHNYYQKYAAQFYNMAAKPTASTTTRTTNNIN